MSTSRIFIAFLCLLSLVCNAKAENLNSSLTLDEALSLAYQHNPQMKQARENIHAKRGAAMSKFLPNPEAEVSFGGFRKNAMGERNPEVDSYAVRQPLGVLGTQALTWQMAGREISIAQNNLDAVWGQIRTQVIKLYSGVLYQQKVIDLNRNDLNSTRQFYAIVENRFNTGDALKTELTRAKIEVLKSESEILTAENQLKVMEGTLKIALGMSLDEELSLMDSFEAQIFDDQYDLLLIKALNERADLKMAESQFKIAQKNVTASYLETFMPDVTIGFERTKKEYENDSALIVGFSYPLWGFNYGKNKELSAERAKRKIEFDVLKQHVTLEVYQAFFEAELSNKQLGLHKKALDEANDLLRQITTSYEEGEIPFMTFLEHLKTIKDTRLGYLKSLYNFREKMAHLQMVVQDVPTPGGLK